MDFGVSKRFMIIALTVLALIFLIRFSPHEALVDRTKQLLETGHSNVPTTIENTYGKIKNKVAVITDTQYTPRLIPLILHYHTVLGPDWPIVFYTSEDALNKHFSPDSHGSAIWQHAVDDGRIEIRTIPAEFDLTHRDAVNVYLSRPWLWEQLAPAKHVLIFQADSMICGNAHRLVDSFFNYDFVGAALSGPNEPKYYNGGLSLRNRTMILDILGEGNNWEEETRTKSWTMGGEDAWFSAKMVQRGANLPDTHDTLQFAGQFEWHLDQQKEPLGYHKVHVNAPHRIDEIAKWCPEIALAAKGTLEPST